MKLSGHDLTIGYRDRIVGRHLDIALATGEVLALLGPNGSGKTTLLKTLLGLLAPRSGEVRLNNRPLPDYSSRARARLIAYVPQSHVATFAFNVESIVLMGRTAHGNIFSGASAADRAIAAQALERFGISHLSERPYTMISGGERQLVLVARALAQQTRLIVMDEPASNLDFGNQILFLKQIRHLAAAGLSLLITTHSPNHVFELASQVAVLQAGRLLACGPPEEILTEARLEEVYAVPLRILDAGGRHKACVPALD